MTAEEAALIQGKVGELGKLSADIIWHINMANLASAAAASSLAEAANATDPEEAQFFSEWAAGLAKGATDFKQELAALRANEEMLSAQVDQFSGAIDALLDEAELDVVFGETTVADAEMANLASVNALADEIGQEVAGETQLDGMQLSLDVGGLIPVVGIFADLSNVGVSLHRGNIGDAFLNGVAAIPIAGQLSKGSQLALKTVDKIADARRIGGRALLSVVKNRKLKGAIDALYRTTDKFPGGTAAAIRHTKRTGQLVGGSDHIIKGMQRRTQLMKLIRGGGLNLNDKAIAIKEAKKLQNALSGL